MYDLKMEQRKDVPFTLQVTPAMMNPGSEIHLTPKSSASSTGSTFLCCSEKKTITWTYWLIILSLLTSGLVFSMSKMSKKQSAFSLTKADCKRHNRNQITFHKLFMTPNEVQLNKFEDYKKSLAALSTDYPTISIKVIFVLDYFIDDLNPLSTTACDAFMAHIGLQTFAFDIISKFVTSRELKQFSQKYTNVKFFIVPMNRYLRQTKIEQYWNVLPKSVLLFLVKAIHVAQEGGTAIDLDYFNDLYGSWEKDDKVMTLLESLATQKKRVKKLDNIRRRRSIEIPFMNDKGMAETKLKKSTEAPPEENLNQERLVESSIKNVDSVKELEMKQSTDKPTGISPEENVKSKQKDLISQIISQITRDLHAFRNTGFLRDSPQVLSTIPEKPETPNGERTEKIIGMRPAVSEIQIEIDNDTDSNSMYMNPMERRSQIEAFPFIRPSFIMADPILVAFSSFGLNEHDDEAILEANGRVVSSKYAFHPFLNSIINNIRMSSISSSPYEIIDRSLFICSGFTETRNCQHVTVF